MSARTANLLGALAVALHDRVDHAVRKVTGLAGEAPAAVATIGTRPGRSIEHLRRTLGLSHSGAVRLVDRLEERGWVARRSGGARAVSLELTGAGRRVFEEIRSARRAVLVEALAPVGPRDRRALERALGAVLGGLPGSRSDAWRICRLCEHGVCRGGACPVGSAVDAIEARGGDA